MNSSLVFAASCALSGCLAIAVASADEKGCTAWRRAWEAAASITNDPVDRARTQFRIIERGVRFGVDPAHLESWAREIGDWQRYEALASVSAAYLRTHDIDAAKKLAFEALYRAPLFPPDKRDRIIASALWVFAKAGDVGTIEEIRSRYQAGDRMRSVASAALGLSFIRVGRAEEGMQVLSRLSGSHPFDLAGLRTRALMAAAEDATAANFEDIFHLAWSQAGEGGNYRSIDERLHLIEMAARVGAAVDLSALLAEVSQMMDQIPAPRLARCAQWAGLAAAWGLVGREEETRQAAEMARACWAELELIERPALMARAAVGLARAGLMSDAHLWFRDARKDAEELVNLRPRAMALAEVYLAMAEARIDPESSECLSPIAASADP